MSQKIYVNCRFLSQPLTGVQRFASELCKLLKDNDSFIFLAPQKIGNQEVAQQLNVRKIGTKSGYYWEQIELPRFLKKEGSPLLFNFCNLAPINYRNQITTIHDVAFLHNPKWFSWQFRLTYKLLIPLVIRRSQSIITVSNFSKKELLSFYPNQLREKAIHVICNGVSDMFASGNNKKDFILSVGSLDPRKNFKFLMDAYCSSNLKLPLYIVGGKAKSFAKQDFETCESIKFLGHLSDDELKQYYAQAKLFIYPSLYEGFGLPPLEAMKSGTPVLASDIPVFNEVLGESCLYFDPRDTKSLQDKINKLLKNEELSDQLIKLGIRKSAEYTWQSSARKIEQIVKAPSTDFVAK